MNRKRRKPQTSRRFWKLSEVLLVLDTYDQIGGSNYKATAKRLQDEHPLVFGEASAKTKLSHSHVRNFVERRAKDTLHTSYETQYQKLSPEEQIRLRRKQNADP